MTAAEPAPEEFGAGYWEQRYRHHHGTSRPHAPSPQLVAEVAALEPGTALDAGCGEGADARWLAALGWRVTAVDVAATALHRAQQHALASGGPAAAERIDWQQADLLHWTPEHRFDLVTSQYVHLPGPRETFFRRLAAAVAPGGTLLIVGHDPADRHTAAQGPGADAYVTAEDIAAVLDPGTWDVLVAETRTRTVTGPDGSGAELCDAVLRARRREG
ncbi:MULTISPECIES: class I SAM-dependent methyltransferase [Streptomyces]|uniref:class I SAM-dependent methyltransferase n=1 Tax=Streptomyces TaxID=1883 RepID=UPI0004CCE2A5|nr:MULTISPECIES: class I SAM-dependent methyltransferase [Streptomyces]